MCAKESIKYHREEIECHAKDCIKWIAGIDVDGNYETEYKHTFDLFKYGSIPRECAKIFHQRYGFYDST